MIRLASILILSLLFSCTPDLPDSDVLIQEFYEKRVKKLELEKWDDCVENITQEAKKELDSIVHRLMETDAMDTINFPSKPIRPSAPDHIIGTVKRFEVGEKQAIKPQ